MFPKVSRVTHYSLHLFQSFYRHGNVSKYLPSINHFIQINLKSTHIKLKSSFHPALALCVCGFTLISSHLHFSTLLPNPRDPISQSEWAYRPWSGVQRSRGHLKMLNWATAWIWELLSPPATSPNSSVHPPEKHEHGVMRFTDTDRDRVMRRHDWGLN